MNPLVIANWKMNPQRLTEAKKLFNSVIRGIKNTKNTEVVICPPFLYLLEISNKGKKSQVKLGSQNVFWEGKGAFTGEISPIMLRNLDVEYAIIGHSERRRYLNETDEMINRKIKAVLEAELKPILCIGETAEERKKKETKKVLLSQLQKDLKGIGNWESGIKSLIIAYEPVWAISTSGSGKICQPEQALNAIKYIKNILNSKFKIQNSKVLYGGSVDSKNVKDFLKYPEINGVLVGGASLNSEEFIKIIKNIP